MNREKNFMKKLSTEVRSPGIINEEHVSDEDEYLKAM
jgi:hypothetical protein